MRILYIEDNPFDADLTRSELRKRAPELQLDVVDTLAAAEQRLAVTPLAYTTVLLDLRLPDGDGLVLLNHIRQRELPLVVVILTGDGDEETAVSALKAGADDYVIKQANYLADLPATLQNAVQRFQAGEQIRRRRLCVLYAESNPEDAEQTRRHLARHAANIQLEVVASGQEILERIRGQGEACRYNVLLLDYSLGTPHTLDVVKQLSSRGKTNLPVVVVTGQGNEEVALQALKLGASDYVVKSPGYLYRLPGVLENAFHMAELERERAALEISERRFRLLAENAQDTLFRYLAPEGRFDYFSPALQAMSGYAPEEMIAHPQLWRAIIHPADLELFESLLNEAAPPQPLSLIRWIHKDGHVIWTDLRLSFLNSAGGQPLETYGVARDVTAHRQAAEERTRLEQERAEATRRLQDSYEKMIEGWALALELRDHAAQGQSLVVTELAVEMARAMGLTGEALDHMRRGALLHDVGKLGVPDAILQKKGPLTAEEWAVMKMHPTYAYQLLYPVDLLRGAIDIPYCHHERWDGSGYPHGLKGTEIPLAARIFAVADVWEALNSDRPFRPAWDREQVIHFLREQAGVKFDADVVAVLLEIVDKKEYL